MVLKSGGSDDQDTDVDVANNSDVDNSDVDKSDVDNSDVDNSDVDNDNSINNYNDNSIDNDNNYYPLKCCLPQSTLLSRAKKQACSIQ